MKAILCRVAVLVFFTSFTAEISAGQASFDEAKVADFYRGKTVTIVVGHSAGGGFDRYGRAIARHFGKYIPGHPAILVNNMVGAGTLVSANYTYNQAPRDGMVINSFDGGLLPLAALRLSGRAARFCQVQLHRRAGHF